MTVSTSGTTSQIQGLSILDDLNGLIHGKGGLHKVAPALDIVEQIAGLVAALFPPAAAVAGTVAQAAAIGEVAVGSLANQQAQTQNTQKQG